MSGSEQARTAPDVRMNVKVSRRDFPLLTDDIAGLPKGPRRTNRLAHLATLGLCWERAVAGVEGMPHEPGQPPGVQLPPRTSRERPAYRSRLDAGQLAALIDGSGS